MYLHSNYIVPYYLHTHFKSSHCNAFEDVAPAYEIYGWQIFKWVTGTWLQDEVTMEYSQPIISGDMGQCNYIYEWPWSV